MENVLYYKSLLFNILFLPNIYLVLITGFRLQQNKLCNSYRVLLIGLCYYLYLYFVVFLSPILSIFPFSNAKFKSRLAVAEEISLKLFKYAFRVK